MTTAVVQFDTRESARSSELVKQNTEFCQSAGYDHLFVSGTLEELPPYWAKVFAVRNVAASGRYDSILFLDTDAVVMDESLRMDDLFREGGHFVAGGPGKMNAGVFAVKCNRHGLAILEDWASCYDPSDWTFSPHKETAKLKWRTKGGEWAGPGYEQHALNEVVVRRHSGEISNLGVETFLHCDSVTEWNEAGTRIRAFQSFAAAMRVSKVVHFCCEFMYLAPMRHKIRAGKAVLFDAFSSDTEEAMKEGVRICLGEPPPS